MKRSAHRLYDSGKWPGGEVADFTLETELTRVPMETRLFHLLSNYVEPRCNCLRDAIGIKDAELLRLPNFGPKSLVHLKELLAEASARSEPKP